MACPSEEVIPTVSDAPETKFQLASTALTIRLKAAPAVSVLGVPTFPLVVPGAAVSPGAKIWSLAKAPGLTVIAGLVLPVIPVCVESDAVRVALPAVLRVRLKTLLPLVNCAAAGNAALAS